MALRPARAWTAWKAAGLAVGLTAAVAGAAAVAQTPPAAKGERASSPAADSDVTDAGGELSRERNRRMAPAPESDSEPIDEADLAFAPGAGRSGPPASRGRAGALPPEPAPIGRATDTVVVCNVILQAEVAAAIDGAALEPGTARVSGDEEGVLVVWSGVRIEGVEGQKRASCRAENDEIVSLVLDGEEMLDGPQPY